MTVEQMGWIIEGALLALWAVLYGLLQSTRKRVREMELQFYPVPPKLDAIHTEIHNHVEKEETLVWAKFDQFTREVADLRVQMANLGGSIAKIAESVAMAVRHIEEHSTDAEDWKRRIVVVEAAVEDLKRVVKNGRQ